MFLVVKMLPRVCVARLGDTLESFPTKSLRQCEVSARGMDDRKTKAGHA